jgi:hypothetical protein
VTLNMKDPQHNNAPPLSQVSHFMYCYAEWGGAYYGFVNNHSSKNDAIKLIFLRKTSKMSDFKMAKCFTCCHINRFVGRVDHRPAALHGVKLYSLVTDKKTEIS